MCVAVASSAVVSMTDSSNSSQMQWQSIVVVAVQSTQPQLIRQLNLSAIETIVIDFELIGELEDGMQLEIYRFEESSGLALFTHAHTQ